jgi:hypothetical protein
MTNPGFQAHQAADHAQQAESRRATQHATDGRPDGNGRAERGIAR